MNDIARQRARRKVRAVVPARLVAELDEILTRVAESSRYAIIESLHLGHIVKGKSKIDATIEWLTLAEVTQLGAEAVSELPGMGPAKVRKLIQFLRGLVDDEPALKKESEVITETASGRQARSLQAEEAEDLPHLSSVQAEQSITKALEALKTNPFLVTMRGRHLGEFWDPAWPKAPFEESIQLGQLVEMRADYLLKKNSFFGKKVSAFIRAVERAAASGATSVTSKAGGEQWQDVTGRTWQDESSEGKHLLQWVGAAGAVSSMSRASLSFFASQLSLVAGSKNVLARVALGLTHLLQPQDFLLLWLLEDFPLGNVSPFLKGQSIKSPEHVSFLRAAIRRMLIEDFSNVTNNWEALLGGPGVPTFLLVDPYLDSAWDRDLQEVVVALCVRSLGAVHPQLGGHSFLRIWTMDQINFETAIQAVEFLKKGDAHSLERQVKSLLPHFDASDIIARLDEKKS